MNLQPALDMMHTQRRDELEELRAQLYDVMMRLFDGYPDSAHLIIRECENDAFYAIVGVLQTNTPKKQAS